MGESNLMRYSQLLIPTVKEVPAEAEIPSHQLMIRAGFIRKLASGTYIYMPLGQRMLLKVIAIVRAEMNAAGAQEITMPILQPMELWHTTGRDVVFKEIMCQFTDRHGRLNALAPTAEEVVTSIAASEINSYRQLPVNLYQIHDKFRDEFRPQYGVIRSREFLMKDAYSFDADVEGLGESYRKMYDAYCRIFGRCGLKYVVVQAESGGMGGTDTEEFMVPSTVGDVLVTTADGSYAANIEKAQVDPLKLTAAELAKHAAAGPIEPVYTPGVGSIDAVCRFLQTQPTDMIKTLIYTAQDPDALAQLEKVLGASARAFEDVKAAQIPMSIDDNQTMELLSRADLPPAVVEYIRRFGRPISGAEHLDMVKRGEVEGHAVDRLAALYRRTGDFFTCMAKVRPTLVLIRGDHEVNEAKLRHVTGTQLGLAPEWVVKFLTEAEVGFAGPQLPQMQALCHMLVDHAVAAMGVGVAGANRTDYHMKNVVPGRDFPLEGAKVGVADIRNAAAGDTWEGKPLAFSNGIEVGHVFKLGTKYAQQLGATFLDAAGQTHPCVMGCYGIGVNRIIACAIEQTTGHDDNGCILPITIAPFEVEIVPISFDSEAVKAESMRIYDQLRAAGLDVLLDDRDARPGVKFKDSDLLGIPMRVVVGERGLKASQVELKLRTEAQAQLVGTGEIVEAVVAAVGRLKEALTPGGDRQAR